MTRVLTTKKVWSWMVLFVLLGSAAAQSSVIFEELWESEPDYDWDYRLPGASQNAIWDRPETGVYGDECLRSQQRTGDCNDNRGFIIENMAQYIGQEISISVWMACPTGSNKNYWMETAYQIYDRLEDTTPEDIYGQSLANNEWNIVQRFDASFFPEHPDGNDDSWDLYETTFVWNTTAEVLAIGLRSGSWSGSGGAPEMRWDHLAVEILVIDPDTPTPTETPAALTPTPTAEETAPPTPENTPTPEITETSTLTPTETATRTPTATVTETGSPTPTITITSTVTHTYTITPTPTNTLPCIPLGTPVVLSAPGDRCFVPDMDIDERGYAHVVWTNNSRFLWYARISPDRVVETTGQVWSSQMRFPKVAADPNGVVHVVSQPFTVPPGFTVYHRIVDGEVELTKSFRMYGHLNIHQDEYWWPAIAYDPFHQYPVVVLEAHVYREMSVDPYEPPWYRDSITAVAIGPDGEPIDSTRWDAVKMDGSSISDYMKYPKIAVDANGVWHVTWEHRDDGDFPAYRNNAMPGDEFIMLSNERNMVHLNGGPAISAGYPPGYVDIGWCTTDGMFHFAHVSPEGNITSFPGPHSDYNAVAMRPDISSTTDGAIVASWQDSRQPNPGLYTRRLDPNEPVFPGTPQDQQITCESGGGNLVCAIRDELRTDYAWEENGQIMYLAGEFYASETPTVTLTPTNTTTPWTSTPTATDTPTPSPTRTPGSASISGIVNELDYEGKVVGPSAGAEVQAQGVTTKTVTTDANGVFLIDQLDGGTYLLVTSKRDFYPDTRQVVVETDRQLGGVLINLSPAADDPIGYNFITKGGKYFIEGDPRPAEFEIMIDWNGTPGTADFIVGDLRFPAEITDQGDNQGLATVSIDVPKTIPDCLDLTIEMQNGEGNIGHYEATDVVFAPPSWILSEWVGEIMGWLVEGDTLSYTPEDEEIKLLEDIEFALGSRQFSMNSSLELSREAEFDWTAGKFSASIGALLKAEFSWPQLPGGAQPYTNLEGGAAGSLVIVILRCKEEITPSWTIKAAIEGGLEGNAKVVLAVIHPPAAEAVAYLESVRFAGKYIKKLTDILKLKAMILRVEAEKTGKYPNGETGTLLWKAKQAEGEVKISTGLSGSVEVGSLEFGAELTGYANPAYEWSEPNNRWETTSFKLGILGKIYGKYRSHERSAELKFEVDFVNPQRSLNIWEEVLSSDKHWTVTPLGPMVNQFGTANQPVADRTLRTLRSTRTHDSPGGSEEVVLENVADFSAPVLVTASPEINIILPIYDPDKPWFIGNDIARLHKPEGGQLWSLTRITDDLIQEYAPSAVELANGEMVAVWEAIIGTITAETELDEEARLTEIMVSRYQPATNTWEPPYQLTDNARYNHSPRVIEYGTTTAIVWIESEVDQLSGEVVADRLMLAEWNGTGWSAPTNLWEGDTTLMDYSFCQDATGEGYLAFAAAQSDTIPGATDEELMLVQTTGGVWGMPIQLTDNDQEDQLPELVVVEGTPAVVWSASGVLSYSYLNPFDPRPIYREEQDPRLYSGVSGISLPGGVAIAYLVEGETAGTDIEVAFYDSSSGLWSYPRQLTDTQAKIQNLSMGWDGQDLLLCYQKADIVLTATEVEINGNIYHIEGVPQQGQIDVCLLRHPVGNDLAISVEGIQVTPANPAPGQITTITAVVENRGDWSVQNIPVGFYAFTPAPENLLEGIQIIPGPVPAGATGTTTIQWRLLDEPVSYPLHVVVDPEHTIEDRDRSNNHATKTLALPDLTFATVFGTMLYPNRYYLTARLTNQGTVPAQNVEVALQVGSPTGAVLLTHTVPWIAPNKVTDIVFEGIMDSSALEWARRGAIPVVVTANPNGLIPESDSSNNMQLYIIPAPEFPSPTATATGTLSPSPAPETPTPEPTAEPTPEPTEEAPTLTPTIVGPTPIPSTPTPAPLSPDLNGDGMVDIRDLLLLIETRPDLTGSGTNSFEDYFYFSRFWWMPIVPQPTNTPEPTPVFPTATVTATATPEDSPTPPLLPTPATATPSPTLALPTNTPTAVPTPQATIRVELGDGVFMDFAWIPPGSFAKGSLTTERGREFDEEPRHTVSLQYGFYIGITPITQAQWEAVMGSNPATNDPLGIGAEYPVYNISWNDCQSFVQALNQLGQGAFRLPSESEWEYACRAGTSTRFYYGDSLGCPDGGLDCAAGVMPGNRSDYMWFSANNSPYGTKPVAQKSPNAFGLYDMHGGLLEWCQDRYQNNYVGAPTDGSAWETSGFNRVVRGGYWNSPVEMCRSAARSNFWPADRNTTIGVRIVREQ